MEVTGAGQGVGDGAGRPYPLNQGDSSGGTVGSWNSQCSPAHCADDSFLVLLLHYEQEAPQGAVAVTKRLTESHAL